MHKIINKINLSVIFLFTNFSAFSWASPPLVISGGLRVESLQGLGPNIWSNVIVFVKRDSGNHIFLDISMQNKLQKKLSEIAVEKLSRAGFRKAGGSTSISIKLDIDELLKGDFFIDGKLILSEAAKLNRGGRGVIAESAAWGTMIGVLSEKDVQSKSEEVVSELLSSFIKEVNQK